MIDLILSNKRLHELHVNTQKALLIASIVNNYQQCEVTGGSLHIVLENANYDCINGCLNFAKQNNDIIAIEIIKLLQGFTEEEIEIIVDKQWMLEKYFENKYNNDTKNK